MLRFHASENYFGIRRVHLYQVCGRNVWGTKNHHYFHRVKKSLELAFERPLVIEWKFSEVSTTTSLIITSWFWDVEPRQLYTFDYYSWLEIMQANNSYFHSIQTKLKFSVGLLFFEYIFKVCLIQTIILLIRTFCMSVRESICCFPTTIWKFVCFYNCNSKKKSPQAQNIIAETKVNLTLLLKKTWLLFENLTLEWRRLKCNPK